MCEEPEAGPRPLAASNHGCMKKELETKKMGIVAPQSKVTLRVLESKIRDSRSVPSLPTLLWV